MATNSQKTSAELRRQLLDENGGARDILKALFDEGTFAETGTFVKRVPSELDPIFGVPAETGDFDPVVCGYGAVDGRLVFAFAQDFTKLKGAFSAASAKKICSVLDAAMKNHAPVVGVFSSAGTLLTDGLSALEGYGRVMKAYAAAKGVVPLVAIVSGICAASAATVVAMSDFILATEKGSIYINPPFIMKERFKGSDAGSAKSGVDTGIIDAVYADDAAAAAGARRLITLLPSDMTSGTARNVTSDDLNRLTPEIDGIVADGCDMAKIVASVSDEGIFFETGAGCSQLKTGLIQIGGMAAGVVACAGKLTAGAARKADKLVRFCGDFDLPLLTLVASEGIDVSRESEYAPYAAALASLAASYASYDNPKVTVVLGEAYGEVFTLLGSKALGADIVYALDSAKIGIMPADAAAQFIGGGKNKAELTGKWEALMTSPLAAAHEGAVDDIVEGSELRQRIAAALEMLAQI